MIGAQEIFRVFNSFGVEYVVIGGIAQTFQGLAIKTDDVDICPATTPENLTRLAHALTEVEARKWDPHKGEVVDRAWSVAMLQADRLWILRTKYGPLDLLFSPSGSRGYQGLSLDADVMAAGGTEVPVASIDSIIEMKEAAGRPKDREHLLLLYRLRRIKTEGL